MVTAIECGAIGIDSTSSGEEWIDAKVRLETFLSYFLTKERFGEIRIINSKYLRNKKKYSFFEQSDCMVISNLSDATRMVNEIMKTCISHGHMSVVFVYSQNFLPSFSKEFILSFGYKIIGDVIIGTGIESSDPLGNKETADRFLHSIEDLNKFDHVSMIVFSHDADYLYIL